MAPKDLIPEDETYAERDIRMIEKYNERLKESLERERKFTQHQEWRGGKFPPFNIEPMPHVRQRLAGAGMTPEERLARIQWVKDQRLAPHEPIFIPQLMPRNPIRRALAVPWNLLFKALKPVIGTDAAFNGRLVVPRFVLYVGFFYLAYYHIKYHTKSWENQDGWMCWELRPQTLPGDPLWPSGPHRTSFHDLGFKKHTENFSAKTSFETD